jgi:rhodanese-related sulfurtransferase
MKRYDDLLAEARARVKEIMPWDLAERLAAPQAPPLLLDVREPPEFAQLRIAGALNVPRGVLEQACEWDYDVTEPALAADRAQAVVVICRSGARSVFACDVLQSLGYTDVVSLKTGLRGWNDFDQPLVDAAGAMLDPDLAQALLSPTLRPEQRRR